MSNAFIKENVPEDYFMYNTVERIVIETLGKEDKLITDRVYTKLYEKTNAVGKSWNCAMIDILISTERYKQ